jgi:type V secretory pathway adhesin AidA
MYRDFETTYSDVPLRGKAVLNFNAGFKIWNYLENTIPTWKGHKNNIKWLIADLDDSAF